MEDVGLLYGKREDHGVELNARWTSQQNQHNQVFIVYSIANFLNVDACLASEFDDDYEMPHAT